MTQTDKDKSLKYYWYPNEVGEQNEILQSLKDNVKRPGFLTKFIDFLVYFTIFSIIYLFYLIFKRITLTLLPLTPVPDAFHSMCLHLCTALVVFIILAVYLAKKKLPVYLVSFAVTQPEDKYKVTNEEFEAILNGDERFGQTEKDFQIRLLRRTGLGEETYLPPGLHRKPIVTSMADARLEIEYVMKNCCDQLFKQMNLDPTKDIDIVICNCSLFNPTPSISAMLMNMYKMKQTCKNYNLAGMGCSAGLVSIDLAKDLLQTYKNINVLVFSTENLTKNYYVGKMKGMLMSNTLFRMGGACVLLSNKKSWKSKAQFEMVATQRIHHGKYDEAHKAIYQFEDEEGIVGVKIGRELFGCVTKALTQNLNMLMPKVMSFRDMFRFVIHFVKQKTGKIDKKEQFLPDFRETFQAYCIHAGGRAIIDGIQENLKLTDEDCMPSRATLYRYGNTSSSSVWYEMKFTERCQTLKKGDKVWQIAFGSGLKCNSVVWRKLN